MQPLPSYKYTKRQITADLLETRLIRNASSRKMRRFQVLEEQHKTMQTFNKQEPLLLKHHKWAGTAVS